jgi:aspartate racemase
MMFGRVRCELQMAHVGMIGGLGVGAAVYYYQHIASACAAQGVVPRLTMAHADLPTVSALVQAGRIDGLAGYLAGFAGELAASGATFFVIPAFTPHICHDALKQRVSLPIVSILETTAERVRTRGLSRVALFGTRFTIENDLFGALREFDVVRPHPDEIETVHRIYLELATNGRVAPADEEKLREIAVTLRRRDGVEAVLLAGTDLNLVFTEANAGFPAVDCAAAHIEAIVNRMAK